MHDQGLKKFCDLIMHTFKHKKGHDTNDFSNVMCIFLNIFSEFLIWFLGTALNYKYMNGKQWIYLIKKWKSLNYTSREAQSHDSYLFLYTDNSQLVYIMKCASGCKYLFNS